MDAVQQDRTDANKAARFNMTAMQRHAMSDGDLVLEDRRVRFRGDVDHRHVLDVCPRSDADVIHISPHDRTEPHARIFAYLDVSDHESRLCDEGRVRNNRSLTIEV